MGSDYFRGFEARFERRIMTIIEEYIKEVLARIDNFESQISAQLHEAQTPDFLGLCKEMDTLCSEV